jgi:glycosyltransferase involved in cell wall biosynthesis
METSISAPVNTLRTVNERVTRKPVPTIVREIAVPREAHLRVLQLGMGWFTEAPGGLTRYYSHLLASLGRMDTSIRGLVVGSSAVDQESNEMVQAFASPVDSLMNRWRGVSSCVRRTIVQFEPDLVVSHFALYAARVVRQFRRLPYVVHFHGPWAMESLQEGAGKMSTVFRGRLERYVYHSADACICLSDAFRRILVGCYRVPEDRVTVIPGGVATERFRPRMSRRTAREELGWPTDRPILLSVRRLVNRMGLEELIRAMDAIRRKHPEVLLLLAGQGPLAERLQQRVQELELQEHVKLLGFLPDYRLPMALRAADFTVIPSAALEGFGLSAAESLAAGTPPLVTPVGGLPEVVRDLEPALVVDGSSAEDMASGISDSLSGRRRCPTDEECRDFAATRYDWSVIARRVREVYAETVLRRS